MIKRTTFLWSTFQKSPDVWGGFSKRLNGNIAYSSGWGRAKPTPRLAAYFDTVFVRVYHFLLLSFIPQLLWLALVPCSTFGWVSLDFCIITPLARSFLPAVVSCNSSQPD